ncbi:hypothetical protein MTR_1g018765 [Medicago truncatula]|uniref:Uncharacterized protein n=1 Tax=Medicago truncatula TaxID=3880 RepID=A0A072VDC8_MEDTR|nr:hypothetical protein MTR_1g018765 [Medicago truncatula]
MAPWFTELPENSKTAILIFVIPKRRFFLPAKNKFVIPSEVNLLDVGQEHSNSSN